MTDDHEEDVAKIHQLRKLSDNQMNLLHQFEVELQSKEEKIIQKDREVNNMMNHLKEKDESSKKIISLLRTRMQSDIDKIERRTI